MRILVAGDFVPRHRVSSQIEAGDFKCLEEVRPIIQAVDYAIVNFESPIVLHKANPIDKTGPSLKCTKEAMDCIAYTGFNCVTLANNHFRDYGNEGVRDTIETCIEKGLDYVGGGKTRGEAEKTLYKNICGKIMAIINVCENEWSIASGNKGGANPLNIVNVCHSIKQAKQKADYILVIVHGGTELYNLPTPRMKETYRFFIENGADAVVNHHQHCYSGYEIYQGKPIFYGLGNFCFDKNTNNIDELWEKGFLLELDLEDVIGFRLYPYIQCAVNKPGVQILKDNNEFYASIERLNQIINDDAQLQFHFEQMASKGFLIAKSLLVPYSSKISVWLFSKGLLPSFINSTRLKKLRANIQCEAHKDVLLSGLVSNSNF